VADRRVRDQLSEAAAHSRKVVLAEVLGGYPRDRLKEICRALDLADHGKEKAPIVDRILGTAPEQGSLKLPWADGPSDPPEMPYIDQIVANRTISRTLATLRDTLLPKLLSGELRVNAAEKAVARHV
jgi:hypothetical protein